MGKALDAEERLHVCFTINASIISVKHFACDLFHFRYLFKMRYNSLKCVIIFVFRKQVLCHYFNELSFFVVYKGITYIICCELYSSYLQGLASIPICILRHCQRYSGWCFLRFHSPSPKNFRPVKSTNRCSPSWLFW